ncbi:MAG TPA: T9SS type A sorting domain-containing protein [candidate division WOR-3 bacterium]|uniref:T9SS type A sorting domain-containing protein n=1 Tax=candidate division WOR-3 bacterium TaxID=2052148 RepID=A0A9C9EMS8_UNCW3|nr:T9SS type A sorting domain-containing protein [candidate division WOR-3 bacterium]
MSYILHRPRAIRYMIMSIFLVIFLPYLSPAKTVEVINPAFGDIYFINDIQTVQWQSDYLFDNARIELYKGKEYLCTLAALCENVETFEWTVSQGLVSGEDYQIKVIDTQDENNYGFSRYFRIAAHNPIDEADYPMPVTYSRQWEIHTVDNVADVGYFTGIDVDSQNHPHISYYDDSNDDLKHAYWDGSVWHTEVVDATGNVGTWTSLAVNRNDDNIHISYCDESNRDLKYARWNGSSWSVQTIDGSGNRGEYTCIALDSNGSPHISYIYGGSGDLMYAFWTGTIWGTMCVDDEDDTGRYTGIAIDNNNYPHFSYHDYTWNLWTHRHWAKYAYYTGSGWVRQWVDQRYYTGYYTSIAVDSTNVPHISYQGASHCDYAVRTGGSWSLTAVDPHVGDLYIAGTSMLIGNDGTPMVAYYRASSTFEGCLAFAFYDGANWVIEYVDTVGSVGGFPSMVMDGNGYLHISYVDYTNTALKYAKVLFTSIQEEHDAQQMIGQRLCLRPNPSNNGIVTISYKLSVSGLVRLSVYDALGREVKTLVNGIKSAGEHSTTWNSCDKDGVKVAAGIYFVQYTTLDNIQTKKLLLLR